MSNPTMTVGQLRKLLADFPEEHDAMTLTVWLPGSKIDLVPHLIRRRVGDEVLIEGNLREGSALS